MKTLIANSKVIERQWFVVDASQVPVGRLATEVANILRGKNKPTFNPAQDMGDYVIVVNTQNIQLTGNKWNRKHYFSHSGYPGGLKSKSAKKMHEDNPTAIVETAIAGMIPRNRIKKGILSKLFIYADNEHPHEAQKPQTLDLTN